MFFCNVSKIQIGHFPNTSKVFLYTKYVCPLDKFIILILNIIVII
jgi:hypothetical protein